MANLTAKSAFAGHLPVITGDLRLEETTYPAITWVAPFKGKAAMASKALTTQIGGGFPEPGQVTGTTTRAVWSGAGQALVIGKPLKPFKSAALSDQTGGWASCTLTGEAASAVLARLLPIDLREAAFPVGGCARTLLGHINVVVIRSAPQSYEMLLMRSMAGSAAHETARVMAMVSARHAVAT